ncbi:MAG: DNA-binding protein [Burkholderiaceae bacterium]|nr:DNA-binding protein [Burkholderiaceae bacterium]
MTEPTRYDLPDSTPGNSRALARQIAAEMVQNHEIPTAEAVRKRIIERTRGELNPSALTIQTEIKAWYSEEFWPTFHAMGTVPKDSEVPPQVRALFQSSFQTMAVQLFAAARSSFDSDREEYQGQIAEADSVVRDLQQKLGELEVHTATAQGLLEIEKHAHAVTRQKLEASDTQVRELAVKLQAAHEQQAKHEQQLNEVRASERQRADSQIDAARVDAQRHLQEIDNLRQRVKAQDLVLASQDTENRRLALEHAKVAAEATALVQELKNTQAANGREMERMAAALQTAQAATTQGEKRKPSLRAAGGNAAGVQAAGRVRRSLHKPTRP